MSRRTRSPENEPRPAPAAKPRKSTAAARAVGRLALEGAVAVDRRARAFAARVGRALAAVRDQHARPRRVLPVRRLERRAPRARAARVGLTAALLFLNSSVRAAAWSELDPWSVGRSSCCSRSRRGTVPRSACGTRPSASPREAALHEAVSPSTTSRSRSSTRSSPSTARAGRAAAPGEPRARPPRPRASSCCSRRARASPRRAAAAFSSSLAPGAPSASAGSAFDCAAEGDAAAVRDALSPVTVTASARPSTCPGRSARSRTPRRAAARVHRGARRAGRVAASARRGGSSAGRQ